MKQPTNRIELYRNATDGKWWLCRIAATTREHATPFGVEVPAEVMLREYAQTNQGVAVVLREGET